MSEPVAISLPTLHTFFDSIFASLAKSKALAAVGVSGSLADYTPEIVDTYLNAIVQFNDEAHFMLEELHTNFVKILNASSFESNIENGSILA